MLGLDSGQIGIVEKKIGTTIVYWGYTGMVEKNMEATVQDLRVWV